MLSYRCPFLHVCPVCLSATMVYCGKTVGWIKMKLVTKVDLDPGYIVLNRDPAHPPGTPLPQFLAHVYCGQTVAHLSYC